MKKLKSIKEFKNEEEEKKITGINLLRAWAQKISTLHESDDDDDDVEKKECGASERSLLLNNYRNKYTFRWIRKDIAKVKKKEFKS